MQTQVDFFAILIFLLFAGFGVFIIVSPVNLLHQLDRRTGKTILDNAPDPQTGTKRSRLFYRVFGSAFVIIATLFLISNWPVIYTGDRSQPPAEIFAPWVITAKVVGEGDDSTGLLRSVPYFTSNAKQVYITMYTKSSLNGLMTYRWFANQKLQREFTLRYENGTNKVPLSENLSQPLPIGENEVYMSSDGVEVALVRFRVTE